MALRFQVLIAVHGCSVGLRSDASFDCKKSAETIGFTNRQRLTRSKLCGFAVGSWGNNKLIFNNIQKKLKKIIPRLCQFKSHFGNFAF